MGQAQVPYRARGAGDPGAQSLLRNHNERLILSLLRDEGPMSGADIARHCAFSAQTASVITRALEADGLLARGAPVKGKVGKPSVPVTLSPEGAFAFGLRIGRRGSEMALLDLVGQVRGTEALSYDFPTPDKIDRFVEHAISRLGDKVPMLRRDRIVGLGVGAPFELWNWLDLVGAPKSDMNAWKEHTFQTAFARFTDLPVLVGNDATMACNGERVAGLGHKLPHFIYFHVGSFVGGGIVMNGKIYDGPNGNAGALGSVLVGHGERGQLIEHASIFDLERRLIEAQGKRISLWRSSDAWDLYKDEVGAWIDATAQALAQAAVTVSCILDIQDIVIDGGYPRSIAQKVVNRTEEALANVDMRGILPLTLHCGTLGSSAGALGAAFQPIMAAHFLDGSQITST